MRKLLYIGLILLTGCSAHPLKPEAHNILVAFDAKAVKNCSPKGILIGSQGDIISYWFTADKNLVTGAINDLKNQAQQLGGNVVLLHEQTVLNNSATYIAQAYYCNL